MYRRTAKTAVRVAKLAPRVSKPRALHVQNHLTQGQGQAPPVSWQLWQGIGVCIPG